MERPSGFLDLPIFDSPDPTAYLSKFYKLGFLIGKASYFQEKCSFCYGEAYSFGMEKSGRSAGGVFTP
jgi:hypothetical protein